MYAGDTITCESRVIGVKENSNGKSGVVYVRSRAFNQQRDEVLGWDRWVMVRNAQAGAGAHATVVPTLADAGGASRRSRAARSSSVAALDPQFTGSSRLWDDYAPGEVIDHPGGMTIEEADHMLATRLYQNTARIHFDALRSRRTASSASAWSTAAT